MANPAPDLPQDPLIEEQAEQAQPASRIRRLLAGFVDYLVVCSFLLLCSQRFAAEQAFFIAMGLSALYFTFCHSILGGGATIGKKAFGLRVYSTRGATDFPGLGIVQSAARYLLLFGIPLGIAELPTLYFRNHEIVAPRSLLELNMLVALTYSAAGLFILLRDPFRRGAHDQLSASIVVSGIGTIGKLPSASILTSGAIGVAVGGLVWMLGQLGPAESRALGAYQYLLEHRAGIRVTSIESSPRGTFLYVIREPKNAPPEQIVAKVRQALIPHYHSERALSIVFQDHPLANPVTPQDMFLTLLVVDPHSQGRTNP